MNSRTKKSIEEPGFLGWSECRFFKEIGHRIVTSPNVSKKQFEKCFEILGMMGESASYVLSGRYSDDVDFVCHLLDQYSDLRTWVGDYHDGVGKVLLHVYNLDKERIESIMEKENDVIPEETNIYKIVCPHPVLLSVLDSINRCVPDEDMAYFSCCYDDLYAPISMIISCIGDEKLVRELAVKYLHRRYLSHQEAILEGIAKNPVFEDYTWEMHQQYFGNEERIKQRALSKMIEKVFCEKSKK